MFGDIKNITSIPSGRNFEYEMYTYNLLERSIAYLQHLSLAINNTEHK